MHDIIVVDFETARDANSEGLITSLTSKIKPDGRIKDEQKQVDAMLEKIKAMQQDFSLYPLTGKLICMASWIGNTMLSEDEPVKWVTPLPTAIASDNEDEILMAAQQLFDRAGQLDTFVTFNGKAFDIPFLRVRAAIKGFEMPLKFNDSKYNLDYHFDVRSWLTNFDPYGRGTLYDWALKFGVITDGTEDVPSDIIAKAYDEKNWDLIRAKSIEDVRRTGQIFSKIALSSQ